MLEIPASRIETLQSPIGAIIYKCSTLPAKFPNWLGVHPTRQDYWLISGMLPGGKAAAVVESEATGL